MKLQFHAPVGTRFRRVGFYGVFCLDEYFWVGSRWFHVPFSDGTAVRDVLMANPGLSPCHPGFRSVRAFRRHVRDWSSYLPGGTKFRMLNMYEGPGFFLHVDAET